MTNTQDINAVEQKVWSIGNKYRSQSEFESIIIIWSDMIYLHTMKSEYATLLEETTVKLDSLIDSLRHWANTDEIQSEIVNEFDENIQHTLLSRTNDEDRLQIFNEIREDGISLIREKCDRVTMMKILQKMSIDFGTKMDGYFATPNRVNTLMARVAETQYNGSSQVNVYDPAAGSGGSLVAMRRVLDKSINLNLIGQELNTHAYIRCSMILDLADDHTTKHTLINSDTLNQIEESNDQKVDIVITDPPYSVKWNPNVDLLERVPYSKIGTLPPKSKADFAFVLHGLSRLGEEGIMVIQLPHGVLFRGASEAKIRQYLIAQNYIDAVIGLPANLQYETAIPTILLVLRKKRTRKDVLFIDASDKVEKMRPNNVLPEASINTIVETYRNFHDVKHYAHVATQNEILANDFNLNIPRYVDKYIPTEAISITKLEERLNSLSREVEILDNRAQEIMIKYRVK